MQKTCKPALIYLQLLSATPSPTLPVVSEWYQAARNHQTFVALRVLEPCRVLDTIFLLQARCQAA
jgi:hypothetical protein